MSAAAVVVRLACGCRCEMGSGSLEAGAGPYCQTHHERRVSRVEAPEPRIRVTGCAAQSPLQVGT